ncbi:hypothetical protein K0U07_04880 [bacterium]|nr:hypothetical protein [bacterium]
MAGNGPNLISEFSDLVTAADLQRAKQEAQVAEQQDLYSSTASATRELLERLNRLKKVAGQGNPVSLQKDPLLLTLHGETIPLLQKMGVLGQDFTLIPDDMDLGNMNNDSILDLRNQIRVLQETLDFAHSHLAESLWSEAHEHSMKLAMLIRMDPHEEVRTMNSHMAQSK